jgi:hypothetical protein
MPVKRQQRRRFVLGFTLFNSARWPKGLKAELDDTMPDFNEKISYWQLRLLPFFAHVSLQHTFCSPIPLQRAVITGVHHVQRVHYPLYSEGGDQGMFGVLPDLKECRPVGSGLVSCERFCCVDYHPCFCRTKMPLPQPSDIDCGRNARQSIERWTEI